MCADLFYWKSLLTLLDEVIDDLAFCRTSFALELIALDDVIVALGGDD